MARSRVLTQDGKPAPTPTIGFTPEMVVEPDVKDEHVSIPFVQQPQRSHYY